MHCSADSGAQSAASSTKNRFSYLASMGRRATSPNVRHLQKIDRIFNQIVDRNAERHPLSCAQAAFGKASVEKFVSRKVENRFSVDDAAAR
jgi:hypothetical protein